MSRLVGLVGAAAFTHGFLVLSPYRHSYQAARRAGCPRGVSLSMWLEHLQGNLREFPAVFAEWKRTG